jgi:hypothetical protein
MPDMATDCGARLARGHEIHPRLLRFLRLGLQNFDHVTIA